MSDPGYSRNPSAPGAEGSAGSERPLDAVLAHAEASSGRALHFSSAPGLGASAILKDAADMLFSSGRSIVPVYFKFLPSDRSARKAAGRFLHEFLIQYIAFRRREAGIIRSHPDVCELEALAPAIDEDWVADLVRVCETPEDLNADDGFIARAFGAPQRAAVSGIRCFVILDGLENTLLLEDGDRLPGLVEKVLSAGAFPYVIAGLRRYIGRMETLGVLGTGRHSKVVVEQVDFQGSGEIVANEAKRTGAMVTEQSADLIAALLGSRPVLIRSVLEHDERRDMRSFRDVLGAYFGSLASGRLGGRLDSLLALVAEDLEVPDVIELLRLAIDRPVAAEIWRRHLRAAGGLEYLEAQEVVTISSGRVTAGECPALRDYTEIRSRLAMPGETEGKVLASMVGDGLKRAAGLMSSLYRNIHAAGLSDLLSLFDCQEVPLALLDYGLYTETYKGADIAGMLSEMRKDLEKLKLPQVYHSDRASEFYSPLSSIIDDERAAIAFAFEHGEYEDENEVVWLAAEIDSKLEANEELASFWCDRLEMAAVSNGIEHFRIWLVSPEGFTSAAREVLHQRHAIGSSRAQVRMLENLLRSGDLEAGAVTAERFELDIPMGDDTELIAAHAVEDIARKSGFSTSDINQLKTALVEACINAAEHSMSPDGRIRLEIEARKGRVALVVSNRGVRFNGERPESTPEKEERRGWGLKLIRSLVDEVTFERVDDGTRIVMIKAKKNPKD